MHKHSLCRRAVSVRMSIHLLRSCIVSKRVIKSSNFFHQLVATPFWFSNTKCHGNIPTEIPKLMGKNRDFQSIPGFGIDDGGVSIVVNNFDRGVIYRNKCWQPFITTDGDTEMQCISKSSKESCSVVSKLLWFKYV